MVVGKYLKDREGEKRMINFSQLISFIITVIKF